MEFWQNKTALVAGGAGFIGQHLVSALLDAGAVVHVVDDLSTGSPLPQAANLSMIEHDIAAEADLPAAEVIFNLACPASPVHYQSDPIKTWRTSVFGTVNMLEHAVAHGAVLVQASTSEVYGDPISHPQKETDWGNVNPIGPRACYDEGKRAAEAFLMDAVRTMNANVRIARIFNTYGPGMAIADGRAVPNFAAQAASGAPMTIHGDGTQTRSFCHVHDTVRGLMRMGALEAARGEVINLGNPVEVTIREIAERINAIYGNASEIVFEPRPVDDPRRRRPDITKAQAVLGWTPEISLDDGLRTVCKPTLTTEETPLALRA